MIRHGVAPFVECSTKGDKRFSAFCAIVDGKSIEETYQAAKRIDGRTGLSWKQAKGKRSENEAEVRALYSALWERYIADHPALLDVLLSATGVSDIFGKPGSVCQATELWRIRSIVLAYEHKLFFGDGSAVPTGILHVAGNRTNTARKTLETINPKTQHNPTTTTDQ